MIELLNSRLMRVAMVMATLTTGCAAGEVGAEDLGDMDEADAAEVVDETSQAMYGRNWSSCGNRGPWGGGAWGPGAWGPGSLGPGSWGGCTPGGGAWNGPWGPPRPCGGGATWPPYYPGGGYGYGGCGSRPGSGLSGFPAGSCCGGSNWPW